MLYLLVMEEKNIHIKYREFNSKAELPEFWQILLREAEDVLDHAYAPYSNFHVAAAIKLNNGKTITGTNQENSAYPSGLCAERTAIFHALSAFPDAKIEGIAITTSAKDKLCAPCGGCRQVLVDTELNRTGPFPILFPGENGHWLLFDCIHDLFPFSFKL